MAQEADPRFLARMGPPADEAGHLGIGPHRLIGVEILEPVRSEDHALGLDDGSLLDVGSWKAISGGAALCVANPRQPDKSQIGAGRQPAGPDLKA